MFGGRVQYIIFLLWGVLTLFISYTKILNLYIWILKIYVDAMGWVVTPLRSVTFLDDQTTSKPMQEKLHDGQCHKTKTWNKIWNTTALNTVGNSLRIHTTLCSRAWPERNKGLEEDVFCEWGDADLCWLNRAACANHTWYFELKFKNKKVSSGEIDIICYVRYNTSSEEVHNLKVHQLQGPFFLEDQLSVSVPFQGSDPQHTQVLYQTFWFTSTVGDGMLLGYLMLCIDIHFHCCLQGAESMACCTRLDNHFCLDWLMPAWWMVEYVTRFQVFHHCWLIHHRFLVHFHCHHGAFQILPIFLDGTLQLLMELFALHLSLHIFLPACRAPLGPFMYWPPCTNTLWCICHTH